MSTPRRDVSELYVVDTFDTILDPIMILDPKGIIRHANKAFTEKLKRFSKELIGNHFLDIGLLIDMTEAAKKKAKQRFNLALRKKKLPSAEYRFEQRDGEPSFYLTDISIVEDSNGKVEYAIVFMKDITEQIEIRKTLEQHQEELRIILELFTSLSSISSLQDSAELILQTALHTEGIDSGGVYISEKETGAFILLGHTGLSDDFVHQITELGPDTPQAQLVRKGNPFYAPYEIEIVPGVDDPQMREGLRSIAIIPIKHEGEVLAVLNLASHTHSEIPERSRGFIESLGLQLGEIFKRVMAVSALRQLNLELEDRVIARTSDLESERDRAQTYLDISQVIMLALDKDGIVTLINRKGCEVLGCSSEEIIGKNWFESFLPTDLRAKPGQLFKAIMKGEIENIEYYENRIRIAQNEERIIAWRDILLKDKVGAIIGMLSSGEDITERKQAEEALATYTHNLSERVKELTCLYETSKLVSSEEPIENILQKIVVLIPPGWQFPDITCARLVYKDNEYTTTNFKESKWKQSAAITPSGSNMGSLEVYYLEEKPIIDVGPFLKEEKALIEALAGNVTSFIERREAEWRYQTLFDEAPIALAATDSEGRIINANLSLRLLTGHTIEELDGKDISSLYSNPEERKQVNNVLDHTEILRDFEAELVRKDGTIFNALLDIDLRGDQTLVAIRDITERKKAEAALRESEERFRSVFDESPIALEILDADGIVIRANQACKEMFGLSSPEDLIGFSLFDDPNLHEDHKDSLRRNVIVREDLPFDFNLVKESNLYPTKKSGKLFLRTIFAPLGVKPDGSKSGYLVQLGDITDQLIAEQSIREANEKLNLLNEELESRVEIRTKELRDAQEELVRAERLTTLGQISGGVGHELRNPLGAIKNATYFLKIMMETPTSEIKETLEILDKEVENCEKIINSLLDFARPTEPVLQKVDIVEVIQGVLKRIEIPENINVQSKFSKTTPIILGDPHQLERVFLNLVTNSIQAMSDGGTLTLRTGRKDGNLQIFVQDTGIGIPEDSMRKLFEPLFTTKAKGIGLGLSIVKTLVESHKGEISVESEVSKGTTFMIQLPGPKGRS